MSHNAHVNIPPKNLELRTVVQAYQYLAMEGLTTAKLASDSLSCDDGAVLMGMETTCLLSRSTALRNAIRCPSGDQTGLVSGAGCAVNPTTSSPPIRFV